MEKQRICVIGGGLSGLITTIALNRLNLSVDLFANNFYDDYESLRTTAISQSNYIYLKKLNIFKSQKIKELWPCDKMKLYGTNLNSKSEKILNFDNSDKKNNILYMITNKKIIGIMKKEIKKNSKIKIISNSKVKNIFSSEGLKLVQTCDKKKYKYNLVLLCTGKNSYLTKQFIGKNYYSHPYNETSIIMNINHAKTENNVARQFFLKEGPLALLPISNFKTSVVWTVKNSVLKEKNKIGSSFIKKNLPNLIEDIYKSIKFSNNIEYSDLNFYFSHKLLGDRVLLFGDASHSIHPFAGQGFNMIIRDLKKLEQVIDKKINLGLDVGNSPILYEFIDETKSSNFIYSTSIEIIKKIFTNYDPKINSFRNYYLRKLNSNNIVKNFFVKIADEGINL